MASTAVVMTTYNGEKYIIEQLDSIRKQTKSPDEVVICDDLSTDNTVELVKDFIRQYHLINWRLYINDVNKGWKKNFIDAIGLSTKDYIFLADQDDIWEDYKIETMYNVLNNNNNISLLTADFTIFYSEQDTLRSKRNFYSFKSKSFYLDSIWNGRGCFSFINKFLKGHKKFTHNLVKIPFDEYIFNSQKQGCVMAFKLDFFNNYKKYWSEKCPHDSLLWFCSALNDSLYYYDISVLNYRHHNSNTGFSDTLGEGLTRRTEIQKISDFLVLLDSFESISTTLSDQKKEKITQVLDKIKKCYRLRVDFLNGKNIKIWFKIFKYRKIIGKRQYLFDFLLAYFT